MTWQWQGQNECSRWCNNSSRTRFKNPIQLSLSLDDHLERTRGGGVRKRLVGCRKTHCLDDGVDTTLACHLHDRLKGLAVGAVDGRRGVVLVILTITSVGAVISGIGRS